MHISDTLSNNWCIFQTHVSWKHLASLILLNKRMHQYSLKKNSKDQYIWAKITNSCLTFKHWPTSCGRFFMISTSPRLNPTFPGLTTQVNTSSHNSSPNSDFGITWNKYNNHFFQHAQLELSHKYPCHDFFIQEVCLVLGHNDSIVLCKAEV